MSERSIMIKITQLIKICLPQFCPKCIHRSLSVEKRSKKSYRYKISGKLFYFSLISNIYKTGTIWMFWKAIRKYCYFIIWLIENILFISKNDFSIVFKCLLIHHFVSLIHRIRNLKISINQELFTIKIAIK